MSSDSQMSDSAESAGNQNRTLSSLFSLALGLAAASQDLSQATDGQSRTRFRLLRMGRTMMIIEDSGDRDLETLLADLRGKSGPLPASKASIDAMSRVSVTEAGIDCPICLDDFAVGGEAREMPCKHRFHAGCIEKWLGLHGSCPVCRFAMPVDEERRSKTGGGGGYGGGDGEEDRVVREIEFRVWIGGDLMDTDTDTDRSSGRDSVDSNSESRVE